MRRLLLVLVLFLLSFSLSWGMFPVRGAGKPDAGKGDPGRFFRPPSEPRATAAGLPRKRLNLSEIYFRKPELKGAQREALRRAAAAVPDFGVVFDERSGLPLQIKGAPLFAFGQGFAAKTEAAKVALSALLRYRDLLRIEDPVEEFHPRAELRDEDGRLHLRFEQRYRGLRYFGKEIVVHLDGRGVYLIEGRYAETPKGLETEPLIPASEAARIASEALGVDPYTAVHTTELGVAEDDAGLPRLCWRVELSAEGRPWEVLVDARLGIVLRKMKLCYDMAVPGSGTGDDGVRRQFFVWQEAGSYYLIDTTLPFQSRDPSVFNNSFGTGNIVIMQLEYGIGPPYDNILWLSSNDPHYWPSSAVSVWYGLRETVEYFYRIFGREGLDGRGSSLVGIVNLQQPNAFYSHQNDFMVFGTGDGFQMGPFTALDVVAHEFTHGVTNYTARLEYAFQSGALNEAFSDIFAAMVDRDDWLMGEDVVLVPPYNLRDLSNPHNSLHPQPAHMNEYRNLPFEDDNGGVHVNSTIPSHAAYLLAENIGREKAERIFYRVLTRHLTPQSDFRHFCLAVVQAAEELYGPAEREAAVQACNRVGIIEGEVPGPSPEPEPEPLPPIETEDYLLFFFLMPDYETGEFRYYLGERTPSGELYYVSETPAHPTRPAPYHYAGSHYILFVDENYNLRYANIASETYEEHVLNDSGNIWSVATSPATDWVFYTSTSSDDNRIYAWKPATDDHRTYEIAFYPPDAAEPLRTFFPDVVTVTPDGTTVYFDCYNSITIGGRSYEFWAIGKLDIVSGYTSLVFPVPQEGYHIGNPAAAHTRPNLLAYDIWLEGDRPSTVETRILDLSTGRSGLVWEGQRVPDFGTSGWPSFNGDDGYVVLQDFRYETAEVLVAVPVRRSGEVWVGDRAGAIDLVRDPNGFGVLMPVVYRPGQRQVRPRAEIEPRELDFGTVSVGGERRLAVIVRNTGNYPLELRGSVVEGEAFRAIAHHRRIAPGEEYRMEVVFAPRRTGLHQGNLRIYLSDPDLPETTVALRGYGGEGGALSVDLRVNGADGPLTLYREDSITIRVSLDVAGAGGRGDYFLWARIPGGDCYCYFYPSVWLPCTCGAPRPAYQGALVGLRGFLAYQAPCAGLPVGDYELFFAVDTDPDGALSPEAAEDTVSFRIR